MNVSSRCWSPFYANECVFSRNEQQKVYINTNEIPGELSREKMISSHVKFTCEKITVAMAT